MEIIFTILSQVIEVVYLCETSTSFKVQYYLHVCKFMRAAAAHMTVYFNLISQFGPSEARYL